MKKISRVTVETTFDPLTVLDDKSILVSIHLLYDRNIFGTEELRISMAGVSRFETRPSRVVRFRFTRFKQFRACKHFCPPLSNFLRLNCCFLSLSLSLSLSFSLPLCSSSTIYLHSNSSPWGCVFGIHGRWESRR